MPLDVDARRYADNLFFRERDELQAQHEEAFAAIRVSFTDRGAITTGTYIDAVARERAKFTGKVCEAKAETLLQAYERAGIPLDDTAFQEITEEVTRFCGEFAQDTARAVQDTIRQTFPAQADAITPQKIAGFDRIITSYTAAIHRDLRIRRDEIILDNKKLKATYAAGLGKKWDVFISHASEDKESFVRPLARALTDSGLVVWYDEWSLTVGDRLRQKIDEGLAASRYGIVVLSGNFFSKRWPQDELEGLFSREIAGVKVILPVWHNIDVEGVRQYSPMLAGRVAATGSIDNVVGRLRRAMGL